MTGQVEVVLACVDANGSPTVCRHTVLSTAQDVDRGIHYERAEVEACEQGFEGPFLGFDRNEVGRLVSEIMAAHLTGSFDPAWWNSKDRSPGDLAVVVACRDASGVPNAVTVAVQASPEEYRAGIHYDRAIDQAKSLHYEAPFIAFDPMDLHAVIGVLDQLNKEGVSGEF